MLATIMMDRYGPGEADKVAEALDRICKPPHQKVFSRVGIYCYWDFDARDILYIGLTGSQPKRFRQHNGLEDCEANCCKQAQIERHLISKGKIGISLLLQSKMQDDGILEKFDDWTLEESVGFSDSYKNVEFAEGQLLDIHVKKHGGLPPWNGNKGSREGHGSPTYLRGSWLDYGIVKAVSGRERTPLYDVLDDFVGKSMSPLVARHTIREMPVEHWSEVTEDVMHGIRMYMVGHNVTYEAAARITKAAPQGEYVDWIEEEEYLKRVPSIFLP